MRIPPLFLTPFFLLLSLHGLAAAPKIATIDASKIMEEYADARVAEAELKEGRENLDNDPRKKALDKLTEEYKEAVIATQEVKKDSPEFEDLVKTAKEAETAYVDLKNQWTIWRDQQLKELTKSFSTATRQNYTHIAKISGELGENLGYDWVIETSGATNSHIPVVLYLKNATDITDKVIAKLNEKTPEIGADPAEPGQ